MLEGKDMGERLLTLEWVEEPVVEMTRAPVPANVAYKEVQYTPAEEKDTEYDSDDDAPPTKQAPPTKEAKKTAKRATSEEEKPAKKTRTVSEDLVEVLDYEI